MFSEHNVWVYFHHCSYTTCN